LQTNSKKFALACLSSTKDYLFAALEDKNVIIIRKDDFRFIATLPTEDVCYCIVIMEDCLMMGCLDKKLYKYSLQDYKLVEVI
jgi:hypothetical protein